MPDPSIELTCPGEPGHAAHVKRQPNPAIVRTFPSGLRPLRPAARLER
jgi:hypothetical protein